MKARISVATALLLEDGNVERCIQQEAAQEELVQQVSVPIQQGTQQELELEEDTLEVSVSTSIAIWGVMETSTNSHFCSNSV